MDNIRPPPPGLGGAAWTPASVGAPQPPRPWPGTQAEGPQQQTRSRHVDSEAAPARSGPLRGACAVGRGGGAGRVSSERLRCPGLVAAPARSSLPSLSPLLADSGDARGVSGTPNPTGVL